VVCTTGAAGAAATTVVATAATGALAGAPAAAVAAGDVAGFPIVVVVVHPAINIAMQASARRIRRGFPESIQHTGFDEEKRIAVLFLYGYISILADLHTRLPTRLFEIVVPMDPDTPTATEHERKPQIKKGAVSSTDMEDRC
jgi:hypothetical protein